MTLDEEEYVMLDTGCQMLDAGRRVALRGPVSEDTCSEVARESVPGGRECEEEMPGIRLHAVTPWHADSRATQNGANLSPGSARRLALRRRTSDKVGRILRMSRFGAGRDMYATVLKLVPFGLPTVWPAIVRMCGSGRGS